ncbi:carbonic anhydrase 2-like [Gastrolobium bilobum]|uniref:carbonic anhydrase 2-like n=1 Tax=Gastrolobium bilobum TaxID=150636 RepID=UPI002AB235EB|nr:carbonic anhydrase 2-like [Gastrolobium bilobum]XP_061365375.1 carbonic anhydrase 2-like [Gastrolobium bilobum]
MAKQTSDLAIEELKKLLREKEELNEVVTAKIEELIAELKGNHPHPFDPAVEKIIEGFTDFKINEFDKHPDLYAELALDQKPKFLVFACSDSRVSPTFILNFQPGEAFMVRNIANMVPPFNQLRYSGVGAAIEYAITALEVSNILVIGHSRCGGIKRLMKHPEDGSAPFDFIDDWVKIGLPAKIKVLKEYEDYDSEEQCKFCEKESVNNSLVNLRTYPYVEKETRNNNLRLSGGYYDFVEGEFKLWKYKSEFTEPITIPLSTNELTL